MKNRFTFLMAFCLMAFATSAQTVDVVSGLSFPFGLALHGNELYISENGSDEISKIDLSASTPAVKTVVSGQSYPAGLLLIGNDLYFTEILSGKVKRFDITSSNPVPETVVRIPGGNGASEIAGGLALYKGELYVSTLSQGRIVKFKLDETNPTIKNVVSGLGAPLGLEIKGDNLYVSEFDGGKISKIDLSQPTLTVKTVVSGISRPGGLNFNGNFLYIASGHGPGGKISKIDASLSTPVLENVVTNLNGPRLSVFNGLDLYIAESGTRKIIKLKVEAPSFSPLGTICSNTTPTDLGGASPTGGTYSGPGVTNNGNGETFTFNPTTAGGPSTYTVTYTAVNGQTATSTLTVVKNCDDNCGGANNINALFGGAPNVPQTSSLYDNTGYNSTGDPATGYECFDDVSANKLQHTIWYTFTGNGNTYRMKTVKCNATNYIAGDGDTQMAIYSGSCTNPIAVACSEDEDSDKYNVKLELKTEAGVTYYVMVDGWTNGISIAEGEFCLEVTNLGTSAVIEISGTDISVFPNPTTGMVQLTNVQADLVQVFDNTGRLVLQVKQPGNSISIENAPAGMYFLKITEGRRVYSARVVKE